MNNAGILTEQKVIKPDLKLNTHYVSLNEFIWKVLLGLYGGGPEILNQNQQASKK